MQITKREIKIFALGIITGILIVFFYDFKENVNDFKNGLIGGWEEAGE